jgi:Protein of unknown function (DUF2589)
MSLVQELNSLDFGVYIGGPLQAAVDAQQAASIAQVEFINAIGFEGEGADRKLRYVDFSHKKKVPNPNYDPEDESSQPYLERDVLITVPFLTILTVPALRIDEVNIEFNAKLTSVETQTASSEFAAGLEVSGKFWKVRFKATASYKRTTSSTSTVEKTYNLGVRVRAVQDELPAGLDRVLTMLEDSIAQQEKVAPDAAPSGG